MVPTVGLEPTTSRSSDGRSTSELHWHWRPQTDLHCRKAILQIAAFAARPCGPGGSARIRTSVSDFGDRYPAARRPTRMMVDRQRIELCPPGCKPGVPPVNTCDPMAEDVGLEPTTLMGSRFQNGFLVQPVIFRGGRRRTRTCTAGYSRTRFRNGLLIWPDAFHWREVRASHPQALAGVHAFQACS